MPRIQRNAPPLKHSPIKLILDIVHALRHQSQPELAVCEEIVQQAPGGVLAVA
jgi:hypothetical protein